MMMRNIGLMVLLLLFPWLGDIKGQEKGSSSDYQYALIEAVKQKNLGNLPEAVKLYRLVIKEEPACAVAYYELGSIYIMTNQPEAGLENLKTAYGLDPENKWYTLAYLNALSMGEHFDTMVELLLDKIDREPEEVEWEYQLATVYMQQGNSRKALKRLERIEKERGFSEKVTLLKASIYESEEDYGLALEELEKVMALFPEAVQFRIFAADLCMKSEQEDRAAGYYLGILEVDSSNIYALTNLTDYYRKKEDLGRSLYYLGRSFESRQIDAERKVAIISFYLAEDQYVNKYAHELGEALEVLLRVHPELAEVRLMASDFYIRTRQYEKAYWQIKAFIGSQGANYPAYMQGIMLANAAGLDEELMGMTGDALGVFPDSSDIRFFRGLALYEARDYPGLVDNFEKTDTDGFTVPEYLGQSRMFYAEALYRLGDYQRSDSLFLALIREEPDNYTVLNNYSYYLSEREEQLDQAERWSRETIENNPENATFLDTYAWILYKRGDFQKAEKYIMKALDKGGVNDPEVNEHAGDIQVALNSPEIARSYYRKALILGGEQDRLKSKIQNLGEHGNE